MKKIILVIFLLSISGHALARIEKWECYAPKNTSKFADKTVVGVYKLNTDEVTVAYLSNGQWKYYDWCCDIVFDEGTQRLYFSFVGFDHIFDLVSKERFVSNFKYLCRVIN